MTSTSRMIGALILAAGFHATASHAQSVVGKWEGIATTPQGGQPVTVTLDSSAAGWKGTATSDMGGTVDIYNIGVKADTVKFSLDVQGTTIGMLGLLTVDRKVLNGYIYADGSEVGTFKFTHAAVAADKPKSPALK
jgi:hypothetical protein